MTAECRPDLWCQVSVVQVWCGSPQPAMCDWSGGAVVDSLTIRLHSLLVAAGESMGTMLPRRLLWLSLPLEGMK